MNPTFKIERSGSSMISYNYCYVSTFNRYYFITKIESVRTNLWRIHAHCDVLKTYANGILGTPCVVARNEKTYNLNLNDSCFKVEGKPRFQIVNFPSKFEGESYVLIMNGAQYAEPSS